MLIESNTFISYDYDEKREAYEHIIARTHNIKKSLKLVEKDKEHLIVRCPLSADYLTIRGTESEIEWLDQQLRLHNWYRIN